MPVQEVNRLLNQFEQMQKMMKMMQKGGIAKMMRAMKGVFPGARLGTPRRVAQKAFANHEPNSRRIAPFSGSRTPIPWL